MTIKRRDHNISVDMGDKLRFQILFGMFKNVMLKK